MKTLVGAVAAGLPVLAAMSPAWAHLDPAEHGGIAGDPGHAFGADHVLATIALLAIIGGVAVAVWRWRRNAAAGTLTARSRRLK
jgi:urease accessory protein